VGRNPGAYVLGLLAAFLGPLFEPDRRWGSPQARGAVEAVHPRHGDRLSPSLLVDREGRAWTWRAGLEVSFMGLATALAYILWDLAMRKGISSSSPPAPISPLLLNPSQLHLSPGFAGLTLWLGCGLIVAGSLLSWMAVSDRATPTAH